MIPPNKNAARTVARIETPDGLGMYLSLSGNSVSIVQIKDGQPLTFPAQLIPEVRGVLLDFERTHWRGDDVERVAPDGIRNNIHQIDDGIPF